MLFSLLAALVAADAMVTPVLMSYEVKAEESLSLCT